MSKIHEVKTNPEFFEEVFMGRKTFEIRLNDRDYKVNDYLEQREFCPENGYTGRKLTRRITYIFKGGSYGLSEKYVVMSIQ